MDGNGSLWFWWNVLWLQNKIEWNPCDFIDRAQRQIWMATLCAICVYEKDPPMWLIMPPIHLPSPHHQTSLFVYHWGGLNWGNSLGWLVKSCGRHVERDHLRASERRLCRVLPKKMPKNVWLAFDWPSRLTGQKTAPFIAPHLPVG